MSQLAITQNIARAKNLIKRDEPLRAIEALLAALELLGPEKPAGKSKSAVEAGLTETVAELNAHSGLRQLMRNLTQSDKATIQYKSGGEAKLIGILKILYKALAESAAQKEREEEAAQNSRKDSMLAKAREQIEAGELSRGKVTLRKLTEEFGKEPDICANAGYMLIKAGLPQDAVEYLEQAIALFPKAAEVYQELITCYLGLREYEKCEAVYLGVLREFGKHPKTLVNMGKLYIAWKKRNKAFEVLHDAVRKDPDDKEAAELLAKVDR